MRRDSDVTRSTTLRLLAPIVAFALAACDGTAPTSLGSLPPRSCAVFPPDNAWNTDVSAFPVHPESDAFMARLALTWRLAFVPNLPVNIIDSERDHVPIVTVHYANAVGSPGPMPLPANARYHVKDSTKLVIDDNHMVLMDVADCTLYEIWSVAGPSADGSWSVGSGSVFDLTSNALRPDHIASSAASGLSVFAGIARAAEVRAGTITHALSIPATLTQQGFIRPATSWQSDAIYLAKLPLACGQPGFNFAALCAAVLGGTFAYDDPNNAPMGLRLRLKASFDLSGYTGDALVLLRAAKTYGLIVSDGSGTAGMMRGEKVLDPTQWDWNPNVASQLASVPASAFEVVLTGPILP
jgi:hypothetical protein